MAMTASVRPLRIRGEVPADYSGPVYHRTIEDIDAPWGRGEAFRWDEDQARLGQLNNPRNRGRNVLTSGLVVDAEGQLLPEWRTPLRATITRDKPDREEFLPGDPAIRVSERVHDAILAIEPDAHIFVPIDASKPDGKMLRYYLMFIGKSRLWNDPVLHPERSNLVKKVYVNGTIGYEPPSWMQAHSPDRYAFGFLNAAVIGERHVFAGGDETDGAIFFSPEIFRKISSFGDIFPKLYELVPIGTA